MMIIVLVEWLTDWMKAVMLLVVSVRAAVLISAAKAAVASVRAAIADSCSISCIVTLMKSPVAVVLCLYHYQKMNHLMRCRTTKLRDHDRTGGSIPVPLSVTPPANNTQVQPQVKRIKQRSGRRLGAFFPVNQVVNIATQRVSGVPWERRVCGNSFE